jgi:hypothetical protein
MSGTYVAGYVGPHPLFDLKDDFDWIVRVYVRDLV